MLLSHLTAQQLNELLVSFIIRVTFQQAPEDIAIYLGAADRIRQEIKKRKKEEECNGR